MCNLKLKEQLLKSELFLIIICTLFIQCSKEKYKPNCQYNYPLYNSMVEVFSPTIGNKITSYTDSVVYPIMSGVIVKTLQLRTNCIIIRHNDTLLSVYSNLRSLFVEKGENITINTPLGISIKTSNKWELEFAIWNRYKLLNAKRVLINE